MKRIVTIGGGTGSYIVLSGLKELPNIQLSALVTMADDGGSTGKLRREWGVAPAGDIRQCLVALSGRMYLNHKFSFGPLRGHKLGNVLLALFEKITGDFSRGLKLASYILGIKESIIPITRDDAVLCLRTKNQTLNGESNIDKAQLSEGTRTLFYKSEVKINPDAVKAILEADYIIICPGNLYCSILTNFIVEGFTETIKKSRARIILVANLVNKEGHTMNWSLYQYVSEIERYMGWPADFILVNYREFTAEQKSRYIQKDGNGIIMARDAEDPRIVAADLLSLEITKKEFGDSVERSLIRHSSKKLQEQIAKIIR